jgi:hypothetical protein
MAVVLMTRKTLQTSTAHNHISAQLRSEIEPSTTQLTNSVGTGPAKDHNVQQAVCPQPVGAVYAGTGSLSSSKQARYNSIRAAVLGPDHLAMVVGWDAPHVVVNGGQDRDGLLTTAIHNSSLSKHTPREDLGIETGAYGA